MRKNANKMRNFTFLKLFVFVISANVGFHQSACSKESVQKMNKVEIVSSQFLNEHLDDYIVIDARESGYTFGHIAGSFSMDWRDFTEERPGLISYLFGDVAGWGRVITNQTKIESFLSGIGVSNNSRVVVVGEPKKWGTEGRVAWNLLFWGLEKVSLLDGGIDAWRNKGFTLVRSRSKVTKKNAKANFKMKLDNRRRILVNELESNLKEFKLIDVRTSEEFAGKTETGQKAGGHIPDATLIPVADLYSPDGRFISVSEFKKKSIDDSKPIASYCLGGVRAALFAMLYEAYFNQIVRNYDGSLWEWTKDSKRPMSK